ncbi:hypothetical protein MP228_007478 [Amoeboaphelidium protococcarum]|nr:hypothetical protein MP228_007478 [Amoeboaphelidium protococcarum]
MQALDIVYKSTFICLIAFVYLAIAPKSRYVNVAIALAALLPAVAYTVIIFYILITGKSFDGQKVPTDIDMLSLDGFAKCLQLKEFVLMSWLHFWMGDAISLLMCFRVNDYVKLPHILMILVALLWVLSPVGLVVFALMCSVKLLFVDSRKGALKI